ncbi:efflux RND transporter periplasmic adaptor subunit [Geosporobacter ferrireducens]|uniref:Efflux transporter periplasmic adaptor subunit n=1 Tax=Geosporobacter ferrireducens TaxID=1424294 RepID=A0A1D8GFM5_9FIRM|nr:efflux RND transporter periplasmic adaptor subunit [Geosporobacter ferrireducens]AOT69713.1 efflux transporter periplasmic adaptor subunit [Geosporobacter ferrireducens]MTI54579.1 efflux RND transporter periplasmic adaptor subunit [Geosporobacter ferrireducens]
MKKKVIAILMATVLLMSLLTGCKGKKVEETDAPIKEEVNYIPVETEKVELKTIANEISFSGKVEANREVSVVPKTPGKVTSVQAKVGSTVSQGTTLFVLNQEDIQKQVDQAQISIASAKANYARTEEQVENAKVNLERTRQLYEQGAVPLNQYEQAVLAASEKPLETARVQIEQAELVYKQALDSLKDASVVAPISGTVSAVNIEVGEMASTAQPAVVIVDLSRLFVKIDVPENMINDVKLGQTVDILISSASEEKYIGKVETISPIANATTNQYTVQIYIENKEQRIKPGMFAKIQLNARVKENVIAVKGETIVQRGEKSLAYIVVDGKAVEREVKKGFDTGVFVEILEGLKPGDEVITKGQHYVEEGSIVKVVGSDQ